MTTRPGQHINKIILLALVIFALASLYVFIFYLIKGKTEKASLSEQKYLLAAKKEELALSEESILRETGKKREELDKYFIDQGNVVVFIERLESLGTISGSKVSLTSVDIDKSRKNILKVILSVSGRFNELFYFLSLLEALPLEISIKRLSLGSAAPTSVSVQDKKNKDEWNMELNIELVNFISEK
ncbi:MAG: hypothetical protein AAB507_01640 [Patescibacteria group bacterium]